MTWFYFFQRMSEEGYHEEDIRSWVCASTQQLPGCWTDTAGIERKTGMQVRSFALGYVPTWVVLPVREQHPQKVLHKDQVVPIVHAVPAPRSDLQQHTMTSKGR